MKQIKIKVNKCIPQYKQGTIVNVPVDKDGVPLHRFWRDRIGDAVIDSCVEILLEKKPAKQSKSAENK